jgi:hypothetical protein
VASNVWVAGLHAEVYKAIIRSIDGRRDVHHFVDAITFRYVSTASVGTRVSQGSPTTSTE